MGATLWEERRLDIDRAGRFADAASERGRRAGCPAWSARSAARTNDARLPVSGRDDGAAAIARRVRREACDAGQAADFRGTRRHRLGARREQCARQIAARMRRSPATVSREFRRNLSPSPRRYRPFLAHIQACGRAGRSRPRKLAAGSPLRAEVAARPAGGLVAGPDRGQAEARPSATAGAAGEPRDDLPGPVRAGQGQPARRGRGRGPVRPGPPPPPPLPGRMRPAARSPA